MDLDCSFSKYLYYTKFVSGDCEFLGEFFLLVCSCAPVCTIYTFYCKTLTRENVCICVLTFMHACVRVQTLAINRGESLKILTVKVNIPDRVKSDFTRWCINNRSEKQ